MADRDWTSLPTPLLHSLAERLIPETYVRLRTVCTAWESTLSHQEGEEGQRQPYYLPRSLHCPWLVVASERDLLTGFRNFLSLPESLQPYRIATPDLHGKYIIGSHAGWLATIDADFNLSLINPLTRAQIPLPSATTIKVPSMQRVKLVRRDPSSGTRSLSYGPSVSSETFTPQRFYDMYLMKIILSSSPAASPDNYIVVLIFYHRGFLAFARAGDTAWSILSRIIPYINGYCDAVFLEQKLYTVANNGQIDVFDFTQTKPQPTVVVASTEGSTLGYHFVPRYLVFSSGDLLLVEKIVTSRHLCIREHFLVEKINLAGQGKKIQVPVKDLGSRSLFLGRSQSLSISTQEISGVKPNCIYYTDHKLDWFFGSTGKQSTHDIGVFDIKEGSCEALYPRDTWLTWPEPIWFAPILN